MSGFIQDGYKPTIAIDFDGVIHEYTSPWIDVMTITDAPVAGAFDFIRGALAEGFAVVIYTARANDPRAEYVIRDWLMSHGLEQAQELPITATKPGAQIYIDDRGWRFEGTFPSLETIRSLKQWNRPTPHPALEPRK